MIPSVILFKRKALSLFFLLVSLFTNAQVNETDSLALVALYNATDGANWTNNTNWLTEPVDSWFGVTVTDGRITEINLRDDGTSSFSGNNLVGSIPSELGNLTNLSYLELGNNQLSGSIPTEIGNMVNLQTLSLYTNQLTGPIPAELGNLMTLTSLYIYDNQLSGSIPTELGNLTTLQQFYLNNNQLSGSIPAELGALTNLQNLYLEFNQLSGSIPPQLGNMTTLQSFRVAGNQLSGAIPEELWKLTNLQLLLLSENQFTGTIPAEIGSLTNLQYLYLNDNQFTGSIPSELASLTLLQDLQIQNNDLTSLPDLTGLTALTTFNVSNNFFPPEDIALNASVITINTGQRIKEEVLGILNSVIKDVNIFPNPSLGKLQVDYTVDRKILYLKALIIDLNGRIVYENYFPYQVGRHTIEINLEGYNDGIYLLTLRDGDDLLETIKLIMQ